MNVDDSASNTNEFDEIVTLQEQQRNLVYEALYEIVDDNRDLLYDLIDARTLIDKSKNVAKARTNRKPDPNLSKGEQLLDEIINCLVEAEPTFACVERDLIKEQLMLICDDPPPPLDCQMELKLLARDADGLIFKHPEIISALLSFLDIKSMLNFSECSRMTLDAVKLHVNKLTLNIPPISRQITTNLTYWKDVLDFFFRDAAMVVPIDRMTYSPIVSQLKMNKALFPITPDSMRAHTFVSFDCIKHYYIVYCDHEKPLAHTCHASRALDCENRASTKIITLSQFIKEYKMRIKVKDDQIMWATDSEHLNADYACLVFKNVSSSINVYIADSRDHVLLYK
ncbi:hypothetical protein BdWA1_001659 [Babesia duncani]|uniref:F-box domain-containing protein n=1 Tax=Babesia duncani TaxID=323732 RepID=A0AAD9PKC5_9APIC|nr:hypothetical protein BdWA1_001659 [Babesia duncani]